MSKKTQNFTTDVRIPLSWGAEQAVTAITAGDPASIETDLELETGDVIRLTGFTEGGINDIYVVEKKAGKTNIIGGNLTTIPADIDLTDAKVSKARMSRYCALTSLSLELITTDSKVVTTLCDLTEQTEVEIKSGSATHDLLYRDDDEVGAAIEKYAEAGTEFMVQYRQIDSKLTRSFRALVTGFSINTSAGEHYTGSLALKFNSKSLNVVKE